MSFDGTAMLADAVINIMLSIHIKGSKVGAHYQSTLFADLNLHTFV